MMGTEIFKIDASWAEKLTKTRGSHRLWRQLYVNVMFKSQQGFAFVYQYLISRVEESDKN